MTAVIGFVSAHKTFILIVSTHTRHCHTCHAVVLNKVNYTFPLLKQNKLAIFDIWNGVLKYAVLMNVYNVNLTTCVELSHKK